MDLTLSFDSANVPLDPLPMSTKMALVVQAEARVNDLDAQLKRLLELNEEILAKPWPVTDDQRQRIEKIKADLESLVKSRSELHSQALSILQRYVQAVDSYSEAVVQWQERAIGQSMDLD